MSTYLKFAAVCAGVLLLQFWNLWRGRTAGRIFLGALAYDRATSARLFRVAFVVNILWTIIVLLCLVFCALKAAGVLR
jgi:ABC-type sugar transport system permease subunit